MRLFTTLLTLCLLFLYSESAAQEAIIIDHTCCDIHAVPDSWVEQAKSDYIIGYGHTSHGSQVVSGIGLLDGAGSIYTFNDGDGSLIFYDYFKSGDLGNPDRTTWADRTREELNSGSRNINMVMWSWCGQVDGSEEQINTYLTLMDQLEQNYPDVTFVYMTGHLNGTGEAGNVNMRNEQIRSFCQENNKILFDFADIESYDPDGNYFLDLNATDGCNYTLGGQTHNWADEWCEAHPDDCESCSCAHSKCLNCQQKGKAFWWMMARIAGWDGLTSVEDNDYTENIKLYQSYPNPAENVAYIGFRLPLDYTISLNVYDIQGNLVAELINNELYLADVKHEIEFNTQDLPSGTYEYRLETGSFTISKKMTISK